MKKGILILVMGVLGLSINAQDNFEVKAFQEGDILISGGLGYLNGTQWAFKTADAISGGEINYSPGFNPLFIKLEKAVTDNFGVGVNFAYASAHTEWVYDETTSDGKSQLKQTLDWSNYSVLLRFNYHLGGNDKFDPYFGMGAGYRNGTWKTSTNDPEQPFDSFNIPGANPFGIELTMGGRYMFTPNIGAYAEIGLSKALVQGGLTINL